MYTFQIPNHTRDGPDTDLDGYPAVTIRIPGIRPDDSLNIWFKIKTKTFEMSNKPNIRPDIKSDILPDNGY